MKKFKLYILAFLQMLSFVEMKYEVLIEGIESAFGKDDKFVYLESLRAKKFNRTT